MAVAGDFVDEDEEAAASSLRRASRTALRVAALRALHQSAEKPPVFIDPLAHRILGPASAEIIAAFAGEETRRLRASLAVRSRLAEDTVAAAAAAGLDQYVILGAGLDTFAYRNPHAALTVFEVDHSGTQAWKTGCLRDAGIEVPSSTHHVALDFEGGDLLGALTQAGFDRSRPAVFAMLGVAFYVERASLVRTWQAVASCATGTQLVFDYIPVLETAPEPLRSIYAAVAARVAAEGEPWITYFEPPALDRQLRELGFSRVADLDRDALHARYLGDRTDGLTPAPLARIVTAVV